MRSYLNQAMTVVLATLVVTGCSSEPPASTNTSADSGVGSASDTADFWPDMGSLPGDDAGAAVTDSAPAEVAPSCVPSSEVDEPDDSFKDTNCDGIDGDKTKAVFVSPSGSDEAAGTMDAPLKTIGKGIKSGRDVYVCNGTYAENVIVEGTGTRVFGGYDCKDGWKRTLERAQLAPAKGVPLYVSKTPVGAKLVFDRIALRAPDGVEPGESSVAAILVEAKGVSFSNARITAGNAADGRVAEAAAAVTTPATAGADGQSFGKLECRTYMTIYPMGCLSQAKGGTKTTTSTCEGPGGAGGNGGLWAQRTTDRKVNTSGAPGLYTPAGASAPSALGTGLPGKPGEDGVMGISSSAGFGAISASGYAANNGGTEGLPGANGGGGSGGWGGVANWERPLDVVPDYWYNGGGGGQGGFGGCGGVAGKPGGGGGAAIALIAISSDISISKTTIETGSGGRGGTGGAGAEGQPGGAAGLGGRGTDRRDPPAGNGFDGGPGGRGGRGGAGGAGGGGPSVGIAFVGTEPMRDAVSFVRGKPGAGGASAAGAGAGGVDVDVFEVK